MRVLIIGGGGREEALGRALAGSRALEELHFAPGNPGTAELGRNHRVESGDIGALVALARREGIGLVLPGPELPLVLGLADALAGADIPCFGPGARASRIEGSKSFAKGFMDRWKIPTAAARVFTEPGPALAYAEGLDDLPVIKASGLAGGKGVILPTRRSELGPAIEELLALGGGASTILIEERLEGEELSLIALSDGRDWRLMPAARDHKRLLAGDHGPNTGGMGSYAPALSGDLADRLADIVIGPAIAGMAAEGRPFVGFLFAGLMLTPKGPRVLEYNCRLGDPEAQSILPLFEGDLLDLLVSATEGRLAESRPRWKNESVACLVLAAPGYPASPRGGPLRILGSPPCAKSWLHHAGTRLVEGSLVSCGGRVMNALGRGRSLDEALEQAYLALGRLELEGSQFRADIGARGLLDAAAQASLAAAPPVSLAARAGASLAASARIEPEGRSGPHSPARPEMSLDPRRDQKAPPLGSAYAAAGVDIDAGNRSVELMRAAVLSTYGREVLAGIGSFGGLYDATSLKGLESPVLVASTDGVGTKTSLGLALGRCRGLGIDMVNHSIDDILVQGARPLFFLDYVAASRLVPELVAEIVGGMAEACREAGCALLGGETAEMPGTYREGELDIAGTIVGLVEKSRALPRSDLAAGDLLVGLASSGLHTNGFSLARRALASLDLEVVHPLLGESPADALLRPHRSYLAALWPALSAEDSPIKALAHITGGGFVENLPRILPEGLDALIRRGTWLPPPIFALIQDQAAVSDEEMARVFNLGLGMIVVVAPGDLPRLQDLVKETCPVVGELLPGTRKVQIV